MHVVVVGGGFGGVKTALELSKRQIGKVTLISDQPYFLHHATLYATATGKSTEESVIPLNVIFAHHPRVEVVKDRITSFDPNRKLVSSKKKDYHYDKLVLALGSTTSFLDVKGLKRHAFGIKTLEDVREFQEHIHDQVVQQKLDKEFFVIGGGLTGVEMASALTEHLKLLISLYRLKHSHPKVTLVEAAPRLVPHMSKTAANKITHHLRRMGISILVNHKVTALADDKVTIGGKIYPTKTVIWTSGTVPSSFYSKNRGYFDRAPDGRVNVNPYLEALDDVYVIGDNNTVRHSGMAIPALRQATHVAKNITRQVTKRPQKAFRPTSVPISVPVGAKWGYTEWYGIYVAGRSGSVVRRWIELYGYCQIVPLKVAIPIWRSHDLRDVDDIY